MRFYLKRVRLNSGGYDSCGRYWGVDAPLFWYEGAMQDNAKGYAEYVEDHIRAHSREQAKVKILRKYPTATFFN